MTKSIDCGYAAAFAQAREARGGRTPTLREVARIRLGAEADAVLGCFSTTSPGARAPLDELVSSSGASPFDAWQTSPATLRRQAGRTEAIRRSMSPASDDPWQWYADEFGAAGTGPEREDRKSSRLEAQPDADQELLGRLLGRRRP